MIVIFFIGIKKKMKKRIFIFNYKQDGDVIIIQGKNKDSIDYEIKIGKYENYFYTSTRDLTKMPKKVTTIQKTTKRLLIRNQSVDVLKIFVKNDNDKVDLVRYFGVQSCFEQNVSKIDRFITETGISIGSVISTE